jgi:hypothetical protein
VFWRTTQRPARSKTLAGLKSLDREIDTQSNEFHNATHTIRVRALKTFSVGVTNSPVDLRGIFSTVGS